VAFSPDGHTLAIAGFDKTMVLWDLTDRTQPHRLWAPLTSTNKVLSVALSPDGRTLATASLDNTVILWDLTPIERLRRSTVHEACTRDGGPLDTVTWNRYAPGLSYQDTCANH
jgi:WD40 repeat protein